MKNYKLLEHTADICIRVKGKDLKGLFKNTALAVFDIIAERKTIDHRPKTIVIKQQAGDLEELLVNWLNELLSLSSAKNLIFSDFKINKLDGFSIEAVARGEDVQNYRLNSEIKAATYHGLKIEKAKGIWQAEVILDV